ncbi:MAG TPA: DUF4062 domain-containing protein, partial [Candidatus Kapabacteria bacterium]
MGASSSELRVFVSSTFRDLQEEREHLVKKIFPEVRARCRERGITFTEVDLRWGVTEEDVTSGRVVRTCLEEIDRTRPYFLGIIEDRYGFVPQPHELGSDPGIHDKFPWMEAALREGASLTDLEFRYGALNELANAAGPGNAIFYARQRLGKRDDADPDRLKLAGLERRVRAKGFPVHGYQSSERLGELVRADLLAILERDFADAAPPSPLEAERMRHEAFASSRRYAYLPNAEYLQRLDAHAGSEDAPLVIYAASGAGKSSLVAHWANECKNSNHPLSPALKRRGDFYLIEHYIGIGAGATDHFGVMRHIMEEIKSRFERTEEIPGTPEELERQFANWLGFTMQHPVVLILDGVNQLSGPAAKLGWLPKFWPKNIRFLITATTEETRDDLVSRGWNQMVVRPLTHSEREKIIVQFLKEFGKALSKSEIERIANDPKSAHPLFLRTLLEELRIFGSHELLSERVSRCLATRDTDELFQAVLERMEQDFGREPVRDIMSLLWAARTGLSEMELGNVSDRSQLDISMITTSLDYHLLRREGLLTFFHDFLRRAVEARYLPDEESKRLRHLALADYFEKIVMELVEQELSGADPGLIPIRFAHELTYQLEIAHEHERLARMLTQAPLFILLQKTEHSEMLRLWKLLSTHGLQAQDYYPEPPLFENQEKLSKFTAQDFNYFKNISELFRLRSNYRLTLAYTKPLLQWAEFQGDAVSMANSNRLVGATYLQLGNSSEALLYLEPALKIAESIEVTPLQIDIISFIGVAHYNSSSFQEALTYFRKAYDIAVKSHDERRMIKVLGYLGNAHTSLTQYEEALTKYNAQLEKAQKLGDSLSMGVAHRAMATVYVILHEYAKALAEAHLCLELCEEIDHVESQARIAETMAMLYGDLGKYTESLKLYDRACALSLQMGDKRMFSMQNGNRAFHLCSMGRYAD